MPKRIVVAIELPEAPTPEELEDLRKAVHALEVVAIATFCAIDIRELGN